MTTDWANLWQITTTEALLFTYKPEIQGYPYSAGYLIYIRDMKITRYKGLATMIRMTLLLVMFATMLAAQAPVAPAPKEYAVSGVVRDTETGEPIPLVTVRVVGTGRSTLSNADGQYRLMLGAGLWKLKFTHVSHYSVETELNLGQADTTADITMRVSVIELPGTTIYSRAYDPAQKIILEAIARKQDILEKIHDYRYDAYTKFVLFDLSHPPDSAASIVLITETQTSAYWEQPDKYKQVITARRQSRNIDAENNLVTVGEILNFNKNRLDIGPYSVVSPTAHDALDFYNYYLLDTVYLDSQTVFRLEIEPKSNADPLFYGTIDIADSSYDVVQVEVGLNEAARFDFVDSLRYSQRFALFDDEYWMPIEIRFGGEVHFGVKFPGIPKDLRFAHTASLYSYRFDEGHPKRTFDEYMIVVDDNADRIDSSSWAARQAIPLTLLEQDGYRRIDSIKNLPPSAGKVILTAAAGALALLTVGDESLFHYNRVEGGYLGLRLRPEFLQHDLRLDAKIGYGFEREKAQHRYGVSYRLSKQQRLWVGGFYRDEIVKRPTIVTDQNFNPTFGALFFKIDPFDYYREKGFGLYANVKIVNKVTLSVGYDDFKQFTTPRLLKHSIFKTDYEGRNNAAIADGHLRSITSRLTYDSRPLVLNKGKELRFGEISFTQAILISEYASPDLIHNDFDFHRYGLWVRRQQRTLGMGITSVTAMVGGSDNALPPQKYFTMDFGSSLESGFHATGGFNTMDLKNFYGDRAAMIVINHDFDQALFRKSRLPLIKDIPFTLSVHGGAFWSEFRKTPVDQSDRSLRTAPHAYSELGFGIGNLTPFITPFNLAVWFTWQLSDYDTNRFNWQIGIKL
jgi:hypothetical protein